MLFGLKYGKMDWKEINLNLLYNNSNQIILININIEHKTFIIYVNTY